MVGWYSNSAQAAHIAKGYIVMSKLCGYIDKGNVVARFSSIEAFIISKVTR